MATTIKTGRGAFKSGWAATGWMRAGYWRGRGGGLCAALCGHAVLLALPVLLLPNAGTRGDLLRLALLAGAFVLIDAAARRLALGLARGGLLTIMPGPLLALGAVAALRPNLAAPLAALILLTVLRRATPAPLAWLAPLPVAATAALKLDLTLAALDLGAQAALVVLGGLLAWIVALGETRHRMAEAARHDPLSRFTAARLTIDALFGAATLAGMGLCLALVLDAPAPPGPLAALNAALAVLALARHWGVVLRPAGIGPARHEPLRDPWLAGLLLAWALSAAFAFETGALGG